MNIACTVTELRLHMKKSTDAAQKTRLRALIKLKEGRTKSEVAHDMGISRTSLIAWVATYNTSGVSALKFSLGGRPKGPQKWDASIFTDLAKEIAKGGRWSVPRMQEWIKKNYRKDIPEQTVWYRMDQLSYSYKRARPHPAQRK